MISIERKTGLLIFLYVKMIFPMLVVIALAGKPTSQAAVRFLQLLGDDEMAFDNLFCVTFRLLDAQWLAKRASYMEFNVSRSIPTKK